MRLSEKGRYAPPPVLEPTHAQALSELLASWSGVHTRAHWRLGDESTTDGADFYVGEEELGHLHLDGEAHVAVGQPLRDALVASGLGQAFRWSRDFVTWPVTSDEGRRHAAWLFGLRHGVLVGGSVEQAQAQITSAAATRPSRESLRAPRLR